MNYGLVLLLAIVPVLYGQDICSRCRGANLCFVADKKDCRKFYMCQNKAAIHRRCSFGTFFEVKNNICNYPARVKCPSDPCTVNPQVVSYADDVKHNCRNYWKCVDGLSTAFCCSYGTGYDSLNRKCVPDPNCTDTCTLLSQRDGPVLWEKVQVVCRVERTTLKCPSGDVIRVREAIYGGADPRTCLIEQDTTSCPTRVVTSTLEPICNGKQTCEIHRPNILSDSCPGIAKQIEIHYVCEAGCKLRPSGSDGVSFHNVASRGTVMRCGRGTKFDQASCGCISTGEAPQCRLEVQVLFGEGEEVIRNMADSGIHIDGHEVAQIQGYGRFLGNSFIEIPFYNNNDRMSRMFGFQLRVYPLPGDANSPTKQILLSNCQTDLTVRNSASLEVYLSTVDKKIFFRAINLLNEAREISVPYIDETWSNVLFLFNGESMFAKLQYVEPTTNKLIESTDSMPFTGKIKIGLSPLKIGGCWENDGVVAYIDEIQMSFCKTRFPDASPAAAEKPKQTAPIGIP